MAVEADRVVVELVAQTQGFDAQIKQSGRNFTSTMGEVEKASKGVEAAAGDVYTAHNKMGIATNNARIAQMELQHVVRGSVDQFAAGASASTIFAQHIASVAEAASFMGGSLGAVGEILSGPWGIAITAGVAILATFIARHHDASDSVEGLVEKLKKHHEQALLNADANEIWQHSIDGVIESEKSLADQLEKGLIVQSVAQRQALANAQTLVALRGIQAANAEDKFGAGDDRAIKAQQAFHEAVRILQADLLKFGEQEGAALTDMNDRATQWADKQTVIVRSLQTMHPELTQQGAAINAAFGEMKKAVDDAAKGGVPFDAVTSQVDLLNQKLEESPSFIKEYIASLRQMAAQLEHTVETAKNAPKAITDFEKTVIGAEGTGPNRMGSSAAGIGQFMPSTWLGYFNRLFPQFADMTDASKLDQRNNPSTAKAVIEAAAQDYAEALKRAGLTITETSLYAMHLLGSRDALKLLNAPGGQQTSAFLSPKVLSGNPFLQGTASDALSRIGQRIGDSSGSVSSAAIEMAQQQLTLEQRLSEQTAKDLATEAEVTVAKGHQVSLVDQLIAGHMTLAELIDQKIEPGMAAWNIQVKQIIDSMAEAERFGSQLVDDVLDPNNWQSWGDAGKRILHEILQEMLLLGAANPLKNLLFGQHNPTLGSIFGQLFGGGGGGFNSAGLVSGNNSALSALAGSMPSIGTAVLPHFAGGGLIGGNGGTDQNLLSINGQPRAMVGANETLAVIPSNAVAAAPGGGGSPGIVRVLIEASPYFDGRVMQVSGPVIAQASMAAAQGGASIGRRNLSREAQHRLE